MTGAKPNNLVVDAHRGDGKRFVVHADEKLTAFVELEQSHDKPDALRLSAMISQYFMRLRFSLERKP
jgi:hypothetical protein